MIINMRINFITPLTKRISTNKIIDTINQPQAEECKSDSIPARLLPAKKRIGDGIFSNQSAETPSWSIIDWPLVLSQVKIPAL